MFCKIKLDEQEPVERWPQLYKKTNKTSYQNTKESKLHYSRKLKLEWETFKAKRSHKSWFPRVYEETGFKSIWRFSKFYKILNSIVRYRNKGKIVRGIRLGEEIIFGQQKDKIIKNHFQSMFFYEKEEFQIEENGVTNYYCDIDKAKKTYQKWGKKHWPYSISMPETRSK